MKICFILYKPAVPANIGAAARALKTMGFRELRLIDPANHLSAEARMLAHGSNDILESAQVYPDFQSAISDLGLLIGTTAKNRVSREDYIPPSALPDLISRKGNTVECTGILFGSEESGIPNEYLMQCDIASSIPMSQAYPSLNLAQAVMLYAYELSALSLPEKHYSDPPGGSYAELKKRMISLLNEIGIPSDGPLHNRILERISRLNNLDINLLHSVFAKLNEKLAKNDQERSK